MDERGSKVNLTTVAEPWQEPPPQAAVQLGAVQNELMNLLQHGGFTPFLGAGASSLRPRKIAVEKTPWAQIIDALRRVYHQSQEKGDEQRYLVSFTSQHLALTAGEAEDQLALPPRPAASWPPELLTRLHRTIVELATCLSDLFGSGFTRLRHCVKNTSDCTLRLTIDEGEQERLATRLVRAIQEAEALSGAGDRWGGPELVDRPLSNAPTLNVDRIAMKLGRLLVEIASSSMLNRAPVTDWPGHAELDADVAAAGTGTAAGAGKETVTLRFDHLAWLSDLLWYTLNFWSPTYPTTSELAFRLALESTTAPPQKAELAQAAEALHDEKSLVKEIGDLFGYYEAVANEPSALYLWLAAALYETFHRCRERLRKGAGGEGPVDPDSVTAGSVPMAFTTNFDRALEQAFKELRVTYHVIFPVRGRGGAGMPVEWRFKTFPSPDARELDFPSAGDACDLTAEGYKNLPFEGPVVVKLHGSPLEPIGRREMHWMVLTESGYLEAMIGTQATPPKWIGYQLKGSIPQRSFWFLGYSMTDWNIRMRLFEHVQHSRTEGAGSGGFPPLKSVLDRKQDDFRFAIFPRLRIRPILGDLNDLPALLRQALVGLRGPLSEPVAAFVARRRRGA